MRQHRWAMDIVWQWRRYWPSAALLCCCSFNDNAFLLLPWEPKTITFTSGSNFTAEQLQSSMTVMSVADTMPGARNTKPLDPPSMADFSIQTSEWVQVRLRTATPFSGSAHVLHTAPLASMHGAPSVKILNSFSMHQRRTQTANWVQTKGFSDSTLRHTPLVLPPK